MLLYCVVAESVCCIGGSFTSSMVFSYQSIISTCLPWFLSSLLCYRKNTSELIRQLITACGEETTEDICDYVNRTSQAAYRGMGSAPIGEGMKTALWQLSLALVFKIIITIFTFGIKVSRKKPFDSSSGSFYMMYIGCGMDRWFLYAKLGFKKIRSK